MEALGILLFFVAIGYVAFLVLHERGHFKAFFDGVSGARRARPEKVHSRFIVLSLLAGIFQLVCGIALAAGLYAIFGEHLQADDPFTQMAKFARITLGATLAFYGLSGIVFSGAINILVAIEQNSRTLIQQLSKSIAELARFATEPSKAPQQDVSPPSPASAPANGRPLPKEDAANCPICGEKTNPGAHFCDHCGSRLEPVET
jgi:hypothetical protein